MEGCRDQDKTNIETERGKGGKNKRKNLRKRDKEL